MRLDEREGDPGVVVVVLVATASEEAGYRRAIRWRKRQTVPVALEAAQAVLHVRGVPLRRFTRYAGQGERTEQRASKRPQVGIHRPARGRRLVVERRTVRNVHGCLHCGVRRRGALEVALHYAEMMAEMM